MDIDSPTSSSGHIGSGSDERVNEAEHKPERTPSRQTTASARQQKTLYYRNVSEGYWVALLLPIALYVSDIDLHRETITAVVIIGINACILCMFRWLDLNFFVLLQKLRKLSIVISVIILIITFAQGGNLYQVASYLALNFTFPYLFYNMVKQHPRSFSFGEGVLVTSAFAYRFWGASQSLPFPPRDVYTFNDDHMLAVFLQLSFFGSVLGARVILLLQKPWKLFILEEMLCLWSKYCVMAFFTRIAITDEVSMYLLTWPMKFLLANEIRIRLMCLWIAVSGITLGYLLIKVLFFPKHKKSSTVERKAFHFAIVSVFLPGIAWDHSLIYFCSSVVFFLFFLTETLRVLRFEMMGIKIGNAINNQVRGFRDHQDSGRLLLTPIYLLVGCALPIWLTDIEENSDFVQVQSAACLSGVISIGIGDTFASIGGTYYGRTYWRGSQKTIEGTVCSIIAQIVFMTLIFITGLIPHNQVSVIAMLCGIVVNAVVEGKTDQIDNLTLPLVTFIVVHGVSVLLHET